MPATQLGFDRQSVSRRLGEIDNHSGSGVITASQLLAGNRSFQIQHPKDFHQFRNALEADGAGGFLLDGNFVTGFNLAVGDFPMLKTSEVEVQGVGQQSTRGGLGDLSVEATIVGAGQATTAQDASDFLGLKLEVRKFISPTLKISRALLEDSPKLATSVGLIVGGRMGRGMNRSFSVGRAGIQPLGILPAAYPAVTSASSTAITIDELLALPATVPGEYLNKPTCGWMMHPTIWLLIQSLKDGDGRPLWKSSACSAWPAIKNQHFPSAITAGQPLLVFGDLAQFKITMFGPTNLQTLAEEFAEKAEVGILGIQWADGGLLDCGDHPVVSLTAHT